MILTSAIVRLRDAAMPPLVSIDGAEELEALARGTPARHGAAFVVPFEEQAEENESIGVIRQRVIVQFLVACVIRRHDDPRGQRRLEASDEFSEAIEAALLGWCWSDDAMEAELVSSRAAPAGNGVTLFVQTWRTDRWIEKR